MNLGEGDLIRDGRDQIICTNTSSFADGDVIALSPLPRPWSFHLQGEAIGVSGPLGRADPHVRVLNDERPTGGTDRLVVLLDLSIITPEYPGFYLEYQHIFQDGSTAMENLFLPIKRALAATLEEE